MKKAHIFDGNWSSVSSRDSFGSDGTGRSLFKFPFLAASHKRALYAMDGGTVTPNISHATRSLITYSELLKKCARADDLELVGCAYVLSVYCAKTHSTT